MDTTELAKTVAILAVCLVWLAKQTIDAYKKRKNGNDPVMVDQCRARDNAEMIKDLHRWHEPGEDPATGQPRFHWYSYSKELQEELEKNRSSMDELRREIAKMNATISRLVTEMSKA